MIKEFVLILFLFSLYGCFSSKNEFASEKEYHDYLNDIDNGFIQSEEIGDYLFEAKLNPPIADDPNPQIAIQLRISRKDGKSVLDNCSSSKEEILEREGYLSFELSKDVSLRYGDKISPCLFHHYERNYGLKPSIDVFFQFPFTKSISEDPVFMYRDQQFGQGLIEISFNKDLFNSCYVKK